MYQNYDYDISNDFLFTYALSIFLTSTAFVVTNAKIRHTSFAIYRILAKLSFRVTL